MGEFLATAGRRTGVAGLTWARAFGLTARFGGAGFGAGAGVGAGAASVGGTAGAVTSAGAAVLVLAIRSLVGLSQARPGCGADLARE